MSQNDHQAAPLSDEIEKRRAELAALIERFTPGDGVHATAIGPLNLIRSDTPTQPLPVLYQPSLCILAQGRKEVRLGDEHYFYDPLHYLVVSVTLPLSGQVVEASPEQPFLCIRLDIDPAQITSLIADAGPIGVPSRPAGRGLYVERIDTELLDAV
ncbi:MAG: AraC family transcriptional regulator, partial [Sphingomonadaceae bacterium]